MEINNNHYIRLDGNSNIIYGFSDAFEYPKDSDICIRKQGGRHFELFGQTNPPLQDIQGIYLYRCINGTIITKTPEEILDETPIPQSTLPTIDEQIRVLSAAVLEMAGEIYG